MDQSSALLEELAKLRQDIERESMLEWGTPSQKPEQTGFLQNDAFAFAEKTVAERKSNDARSALGTNSDRPIYRFDVEHVDYDSTQYSPRETTNGDLPTISGEKKFRNDPVTENDTKISNENHTQHRETPPACETELQKPEKEREHRRFDDAPVVIPIRQRKNPPPKREFGSVNQTSPYGFQESPESYADSLPWRLISRYENENWLKFVTHAGNVSIFLGWGAIACGVLIFIRSFFVSSMVWLSYGLPILSLGAVCLFLGIILGVLAEKMQQVNELKQSLTTHRVRSRMNIKFDPAHEPPAAKAVSQKTDPPHSEAEHRSTHAPPAKAESCECRESDDVYTRLLKLRSEIDDLIAECENA